MDRSELQRLDRFRPSRARITAGRPAISALDVVSLAKARLSTRLDGSAETWRATRVSLSKDHDRSAIKIPKGLRKRG